MADTQHPLYEDILAILTGTLFVALGLSLFNTQGLLTGGTAGIALLGTHLLPINFGALFFLINIPFYYLAWTALGWRFTLNTFISVAVVSVMSENMDIVISLHEVNPFFAGIVGGMLIGMGLLVLFRHKASLGGLGILALYLQTKFGIRAGKFQLLIDCCILLFSCFVVSPMILLVSILGAVAMNIILAINHKPGRYQATLFEEAAKDTS